MRAPADVAGRAGTPGSPGMSVSSVSKRTLLQTPGYAVRVP
jgi:hypothetical protein